MSELFWNYSDTLFPFLVLLLLLPVFRKARAFHYLFAYLVVTVLLMGYSNYLADRSINNMYVYHIYSLVEIVLLIPMIRRFSNRSIIGDIVIILVYAVFWIVNVIYFEPLQKFNSNSISIAAFLILIFSFMYFFSLIKTDEVLHFQKLYSFWIIAGLMFYCTSSILVMASYKYKDWFTDINTHITWKIEQVANIIKFVLISIGIICFYRQTSRDGLS